MTRLLAALTLAAALLLVPASAQAGWKTNRAIAIARIVWHNPNVDRMTIRWGLPPDRSLDAAGWSYRDRSEIWLNASRSLEWEPFCTVVLHEAGHLAGMDHTSKGIMSATQSFDHDMAEGVWYGTDPRCRDRGRPYLKAHAGVGTLK